MFAVLTARTLCERLTRSELTKVAVAQFVRSIAPAIPRPVARIASLSGRAGSLEDRHKPCAGGTHPNSVPPGVFLLQCMSLLLAQSGHSLRCNVMSAFGGKADIPSSNLGRHRLPLSFGWQDFLRANLIDQVFTFQIS